MSVKYQITLPDDLAAELKATAERLNVPLAQFIRDTMARRLKDLKTKRTKDPFASIRGLLKTSETDLSSRVDEILYGSKK